MKLKYCQKNLTIQEKMSQKDPWKKRTWIKLDWAMRMWKAKETALSTRKHGSTRGQLGSVKASARQRKMPCQQARHRALTVK